MKEGFRLASTVLFLLEPASPFAFYYGLVLGISACAFSVISVGLIFQRSPPSLKLASSVVIIAGVLAVVAAGQPSFCGEISMQVHPIEFFACQRLPRLATGFGLFAIVVAAFWFVRRP
jgi:hypothetical protein